MSPMDNRLVLLATIGMFAITAQAAAHGWTDATDDWSTKPAILQLAVKWECMTDDGYGRKLPCSMGYKKSHPNWRGTDACRVKDKTGTMVPCPGATKTTPGK